MADFGREKNSYSVMETLNQSSGSIQGGTSLHNSTFSLIRSKNSRNRSLATHDVNYDVSVGHDLMQAFQTQDNNTVIIQDSEDMKEYSINRKDLLNTIDPKLGKDLLSLNKSHADERLSGHKPLLADKEGKVKLNFRMPAFPFCKTCNKKNDEFLVNREYIVLNQADSTKVLFSKDKFLNRLSKGKLKFSLDMKSTNLIRDAVEEYQIKNGAHKQRDVDYIMMKDVNTGYLQTKLKRSIQQKKANRSQYHSTISTSS